MSVLTRIGQTAVYAEPLPPAGAAFLLFVAAGDPASLPASFPTADAWTKSELLGWFVAIPEVPADLGALAGALQASGFFAAPPHTSFAWTAYDGKAVAAPKKLVVRKDGDVPVTDGDSAVTVGRYGIVMPDGNPVVAELDGADLGVLLVSYTPPPGFPQPRTPPVGIPFHGPSRFCLIARGFMNDFSDARRTGADVSIRYAVPAAGGQLQSVRYPLFAPLDGNTFVETDGTLDPLTNWWTPDAAWPSRTVYRLTGRNYALQERGGRPSIVGLPRGIASNLRTVTGAPLALVPQDGSLVPQPLPGVPGQFYLTPSGTFTLHGAPGTIELMPGLAATERIVCGDGDIITFTPNSPAHAPTFPLVAGTTPPPPQALLDTTTVTAWAAVTSTAAPPTFHAQPSASALFGVDPSTNEGANAADGVLPLYNPLVATFDQRVAFPLAPYAGVDDAAFGQNFALFEQQILAPSRMAAVTAAVKARGPLPDNLQAAAVPTTTPQGFLVQVQGTDWSNLTFASNQRSDGTVDTLQLLTVSDDLRAALQSRTLFLVATLAEPFSTFASTISIADWPFELNIGEPGSGPADFRNVVLFKFCDGKLLDLVTNPNGWTNASVFNTKPADVSGWLQTYFTTAQSLAANNARYQNFVDLLTQEHWYGILALKVDVPLASLPNDLRGLAAGINSTEFAAHHVGIDATRVQQNADGSFAMPAASSLFGLINYVDEDTPANVGRRLRRMAAAATAPAPADSGYAFRVLTLFAQFANSQIIAFDSKIVLTVTKLFDEAAQLQINPADPPVVASSIELFGSLERRVAPNGTTVTVYVFQTDADVRFLLPQSAVLNYVDITRAEFNTLKPQDKNDPNVHSQFRMWGFVNFEVTSGLDIFSFGDPAPTSPPTPPPTGPLGLAYSNLIVAMNFNANDPQTTLAFQFDPTAVGFDLSSSTVRTPSLFTGLPLTLDTFVTSANGTPHDAGYLPVLCAALSNVDALDTSNWFGLVTTLSLGTPGALADLAAFNAHVVSAWSPGGTGKPQAALLIQLPGTSPGKKELGLQQVLKLSIDQIVLSQNSAEELQGTNVPLTLTFTNIKLGFLGWKLPSGGVIDIALAGGQTGQTGSLGWYGVYSEKGPSQ